MRVSTVGATSQKAAIVWLWQWKNRILNQRVNVAWKTVGDARTYKYTFHCYSGVYIFISNTIFNKYSIHFLKIVIYNGIKINQL